MKAVVVALAAAGLLAAGAAQAQSGAEVAKAKGCLNCHAVDQKKVGPAFKDVAAKFAGKGDAELVARLKGGKGHPKINGTDAEIKAAVDYALSAK